MIALSSNGWRSLVTKICCSNSNQSNLTTTEKIRRVLNDDDLADVVGLEQLRQDVGDFRQELLVVAAQEGQVLEVGRIFVDPIIE